MRRTPIALTVLALLVAGCVAHEKVADKAASRGDWKTAEREYAEALRGDPDDKVAVQAKWQQARTRALEEAQRHAQACMVGRDWECALGESSYVLSLDPGDAAMAAVRRDAGREVGFLRVRTSTDALAQGDVPRAIAALEAARAASNDPQVEAEVRRAIPAVSRRASSDAERFAAARQYPQAVDVLTRAARLDPALGGQLQTLQAEYEQWKDLEAERLTREGDSLLRVRRFQDAEALYRQAVAIRPQSRAAALADYADLLGDGEEAVRQRDFGRAERLYRDAARSPADDGLARQALERVQVRRWAIELRSVRVRPGGPRGPLVIMVRRPDGSFVQTEPREGRGRLEASFVVEANAYDDRLVSARVLRLTRPGTPPLDLGTVTFRLSDAIAQGRLALEDGAVDELRIEVAPTSASLWELRGLAPVTDVPPAPPPRPPPPPRP